MSDSPTPVFRFAPSPNGFLHLGHAYSALLNYDLSRKAGGKLLIRMEDIDIDRCTPDYESRILDDLEWLGIEWTSDIRRQSDHFDDYRSTLDDLFARDLVYPSLLTRGEIRALISDRPNWQHDPDGVPLYPGDEREWDKSKRVDALKQPHSLRLDMSRACDLFDALHFDETGSGPSGESGRVEIDSHIWGDVILGRSEIPASYHLSAVMDDALQGVTHIVRGADLFYATYIHRLLQELLELPTPSYHHHGLIMNEDNTKKLSKSDKDMSLFALRRAGKSPLDIRRLVGLPLD